MNDCYSHAQLFAPYSIVAVDPDVCSSFFWRLELALKKLAVELWVDETFSRVFKVTPLIPPKEGILVDRVMIPEDLVQRILSLAPNPYRQLVYWCDQYEEMRADESSENA